MSQRHSTWEFREVSVSRDTPREEARQILTSTAETGRWELIGHEYFGTADVTTVCAAASTGSCAPRDGGQQDIKNRYRVRTPNVSPSIGTRSSTP